DPDIIEIVSNPASTPGADDALLPTISATTNNTGKGSTSTVSVAALEAITSGTISLEASGYIRLNDLTANGGDGALNLKDGV
ncbi:hypothetical protein NQ272_27820, partial [Escherichia coli]|nr:hypothetical protein [Escherichia coli]